LLDSLLSAGMVYRIDENSGRKGLARAVVHARGFMMRVRPRPLDSQT